MTTEELLKPRYKVIADFPRNCAHIDRVFEPGEIGIETQIKWEDYPHLFKKLQWWEEREESDMPEYMKQDDGKVYKIMKWKTNDFGLYFIIDAWKQFGEGALPNFLPATESEYLNQEQIN